MTEPKRHGPRVPGLSSDSYAIWIVTPPGYAHSRCFEEVALGLRAAFASLGYDAPITTAPEQVAATVIVLGGHLLVATGQTVPHRSVIYNLEQVSPESGWLTDGYLSLLRSHPVWDYSPQNVARLASLGVRAGLCEIGYVPALTRIRPAPARDIDVVFVGSINERRSRVLGELARAGLRVESRFGLYGEERDALYARAKLVLNVHYFEAKVLEIVRVSYLLANGVCVVSEAGEDASLEDSFRGGIAFAAYGDLVATCRQLIADDQARSALASRGFELFAARDQTRMLESALATLD